ncbi:MAG: FTR1 family protein [Candidatus Buchananbacteria bacterium]|nr:FTR1 family protein [Candidatus Buchananbacteria bacterium]
MIPSLIIALRETLEAALIIGIIIGYLNKTGQQKYKKIVALAVILAVIASVIGAFLFNTLAGGFEGRAEQIFEGITMAIGAIMLTTMILWMIGHKKTGQGLKDHLASGAVNQRAVGLFFLVFISILREGIELVLFLGVASFVSGGNNLLGALAGIILAVIFGYTIFAGLMQIDIKKFFNITSILLVLFAAGLVAHGIHEFEEAGIIPIVIEHIWDINPAVNADGSYPALHEDGWLGGIMKGLFGYNGNPSLLELIGYVLYLLIITLVGKKNNPVSINPTPL